MVKLEENGANSASTTDHLDTLPLEGAVRPRHTPTAIGQQIEREDRRSTSGGMRLHNGGLLRFWSSRQKVVSLSSWESELCAVVSSRAEALGLRSRVRELGNITRVTVACDNRGVVDHQQVRDLDWQNIRARDIFGCKRRMMKAGWMW